MFDSYKSTKSFLKLLKDLESSPAGTVTTFELFKKDGRKVVFKIELVDEKSGENVIYFCRRVDEGKSG